MQRAALLLPGALTCIGAVILWQSLTTLDYYNTARGAPGSGFLPFWVSLGVVICGLALTWRALRGSDLDSAWPDAPGRRRIACLLGAFAAFLLAINLVGFVVSATLFLGGVSYLLGMTSMRVLIPASISVGIMLHVVFNELLRISLPEGILGIGGGSIASWIF